MAERRCLAQWDEQNQVVTLGSDVTARFRFARGLTKTLKAQFSPEFSITATLQGVEHIKPKKHGRAQGNGLDREVREWVEGTLTGPPSDLLQQVQRALHERSWVPVAAQVPLGCEVLRLGTRMDLLCRDSKSQTLIVVELKTFFDDYYDVHNQGQLKPPFDDWPQSFRTQHWLQLGLTAWLFAHGDHEWNGQPVGSATVLRVFQTDAGGLTHAWCPLPRWVWTDTERWSEALRILSEHRWDSQQDRVTAIKRGSAKARRDYGRKKPVKRYRHH